MIIVPALLSGSTVVYERQLEPVVEKTVASEIERLAKKYHQNKELAIKIMTCESSMYGQANNKNHQNGIHWSTDWGRWQLNDYFWEEYFKKQGLDIRNEWDNIEAGFILMSEQGTQPWYASSRCWNKLQT